MGLCQTCTGVCLHGWFFSNCIQSSNDQFIFYTLCESTSQYLFRCNNFFTCKESSQVKNANFAKFHVCFLLLLSIVCLLGLIWQHLGSFQHFFYSQFSNVECPDFWTALHQNRRICVFSSVLIEGNIQYTLSKWDKIYKNDRMILWADPCYQFKANVPGLVAVLCSRTLLHLHYPVSVCVYVCLSDH